MSKEMAIALLRNPPRYFYVTKKGCDYSIMKDLSAFKFDDEEADEVVNEFDDYGEALRRCADYRAEALLNAVFNEMTDEMLKKIDTLKQRS